MNMENGNPNLGTPDNVSYEYTVERRYHGVLVEVMPVVANTGMALRVVNVDGENYRLVPVNMYDDTFHDGVALRTCMERDDPGSEFTLRCTVRMEVTCHT